MKSIGPCLMIGLKGERLTPKERHLLVSEQIAGVILFKRNIKSFRQVYELCKELRTLTSNQNFIIGMDREGGQVDRLSHLKESSSYPSAEELSKLPPDQVFLIGQAMGQELNALGIGINFAPVLDLPQKSNPLFKTRSFGKEPKRITLKGAAFCKGLQSKKTLFCLKHFPGHGCVEEDSHFVLPKDKRHLEDLKVQLLIFERVIKRTLAPLIMTAHVQFPNVDSQIATFSSFFLTDLLRNKMKYKGVIVSDDIDMKALEAYSPWERVDLSLRAGCNLILACQSEKTVEEILLFFKRNPERLKELELFLKTSVDRIQSLKIQNQIKPWSEVSQILKYNPAQKLIEKIIQSRDNINRN